MALLTPARAGAVKVGRRTNLAAYSSLARPHLDGFEHDGTVWCGRDDDQRGARFRARFDRATTLYPVGPRTQTMMQSYASAAKLRSGGPILPVGTRAKGHAGIPPPRTVIGASSQADGRDRNCGGAFSVLHSLCRTQNNAVWYNALPHKPPQSKQCLAFAVPATLQLSRVAMSRLRQRAEATGISEAELVTTLIEVIARDDLYDAVLDTAKDAE